MNTEKQNLSSFKFSDNTIDLYYGDCIELLKEIPTSTVELIMCDLPYGTTVNKWDTVIPLDFLWEQYFRILAHDGAIILTASQPFTSTLVSSNYKHFKTEWIWKKTLSSGSLNARKIPMKNHESVLVFSGKSKKTRYFPQMTEGKPYTTQAAKFTSTNYGEQIRPPLVNTGTRYPTSVQTISNPRIKGGHPTQKPVDLMSYFIKTYSLPGETVLDNCMGSGTTAMSCIETNRSFIGIELNKTFYDTSVSRVRAALTTTLEF